MNDVPKSAYELAMERLRKKDADEGIVTRTPAGNTAIYELNREHLAYPALEAALSQYNPYAELRRRLRTLVRASPTDRRPIPTPRRCRKPLRRCGRPG